VNAQLESTGDDDLLKNSHLVRLLRKRLDAIPFLAHDTSDPEQAAKILFLPWYSPKQTLISDTLKSIAGFLGLPLITLGLHYSSTYDARLLEQLARALCPDNKRMIDALRRLPYSSDLEDAVLKQIRVQICAQKQSRRRIAIASPGAGGEADSLVSRMLDWVRRLGLEVALVFAHARPQGIVETLDLPLYWMRKDILGLLPRPPKSAERKPKKEGDRPEKRSFYRRLLDYFEGVAKADENTPEPTRAEVAGRCTDPDWADLLARFCGSNWSAVTDIANIWLAADESAERSFEDSRSRSELQSDNLEDSRSRRELQPDNLEEQEAFAGRLRFLGVLRILYPQAFEVAAHELDGADQLYRIHLVLCGATAKDSLLSSSLLPFWRNHLEDPLFCELFYACFLGVGSGRPLVERFESRAQLHRLLTWKAHEEKANDPNIEPLSELMRQQQNWIRDLAAEDTKDDQSPRRPQKEANVSIMQASVRTATAMIPIAERVRVSNPTASDALQAAQVLISVCELLRDEESSDKVKLHELIDELTWKAINLSRGAIRLDASLLRARALALRDDGISALEILRIMRRVVRDKLSHCATQIEEAFIHECEGDFIRAVQLYEEVLGIAEDLGADELVARASSGCLRCDARANAKDQDPGLRIPARIIVQIQSARAPELFPMSKRTKPALFISYRAESRAVTRGLWKVLNDEKKSILQAWADVELTSYQDFNPTIHRRMHDADAIVLLLSPDYFRSPWCVHEIHFALSQHEVRGVPLCWAWCEPKPGAGERIDDKPCELRAREHIEKSFENIEQQRWGYEIAHIQERLRRLFARGRLLQRTPMFYQRIVTSPDLPSLDEEKIFLTLEEVRGLSEPLFKMAPYLYKRAKLTQIRNTPRNVKLVTP
jgi:hypothetical protein